MREGIHEALFAMFARPAQTKGAGPIGEDLGGDDVLGVPIPHQPSGGVMLSGGRGSSMIHPAAPLTEGVGQLVVGNRIKGGDSSRPVADGLEIHGKVPQQTKQVAFKDAHPTDEIVRQRRRRNFVNRNLLKLASSRPR